jgi:hypothetical protein
MKNTLNVNSTYKCWYCNLYDLFGYTNDDANFYMDFFVILLMVLIFILALVVIKMIL